MSLPAPASQMVDPSFQAFTAVAACHPPDAYQVDPAEAFTELKAIATALASSDVTQSETMAGAQATALNVMFGKLTEIAMNNIQHPCFVAMMRLALSAQNQCLRALNTLTDLKNPSIYAHQLNLANQQIVNNTSLPSPTPAPPLPPPQNSLESTPLISQALIHPPDLQSVHPSAEDQIPAATPALGISNNLNSSFGTIRAEPNGEPETENLL